MHPGILQMEISGGGKHQACDCLLAEKEK